ncbi:hypothetical protein M3Y98_01028200 [Aphelenchoides besseyi]|nr:hypothetical protein M3Y98_01028200 [Aphelenchoides besseyi]
MIDGFNILGPSYMKNICKDQTVDDEYMGCCTNECCQDLCVERGAMVYKKNVVNHTEENHEEKMVELGWINNIAECLCECCWLLLSYV